MLIEDDSVQFEKGVSPIEFYKHVIKVYIMFLHRQYIFPLSQHKKPSVNQLSFFFLLPNICRTRHSPSL
ncbi:hypothetical protein J7I90_05495 [Bacillus sp. ISL-57]|nr:hypothetical protein [Bacillus sp. ISL-57]